MNIVKPKKLSLLTNTFRWRGEDHLVVAGLIFFPLLQDAGTDDQLLLELEKLGDCFADLGESFFDLAMPKGRAEFLALGAAHVTGEKPVEKMTTSISVAGKKKSLDVYGDKIATRGRFGTADYGRIEPFVSMPISYETAYGGEGFSDNPRGKGYYADHRLKDRAFPNVVYAGRTIPRRDIARGRSDRIEPAAYSPVAVDWPAKMRWAGTYDNHWNEHDAPGYPRDVDFRYFNQAPEDQQADGFFLGGEAFEIEGMHPKHFHISGHLPEYRVRAFISGGSEEQDDFRELSLTIDTVWFFPHREFGVLIHRGTTVVGDSEASDVASVMLAYENKEAAPRSAEYYRHILALRTDSATALANAFNDSQLSPEKSQEEIEQFQLQREEYKNKMEKEQEQYANSMLNDIETRFQLGDALTGEAAVQQREKDKESDQNPLSQLAQLEDPSLSISPEEIKRGDFDLTGLMNGMNQIVESSKAILKEVEQSAGQTIEQVNQQKEALLKELSTDTGLSESQVKQRSDVEQVTKLKEQAKRNASRQIKGFSNLQDPERLIQNLTFDTSKIDNLVDPEKKELIEDRFGELMEEIDVIKERAVRLARLTSAEPVNGAADEGQFSDELGNFSRSLFEDLIDKGGQPSGRDFSGVNLSGMDLGGLDLSETMLENANLSDCNLNNTNLSGAVLTGATVDNADFSDSDLRYSNLSGIAGRGVRFDNCELDHATMFDLVLRESSWNGAKFKYNKLLNCQIVSSSLSGTSFDQVALINSNFAESDFSETRWTRINCNNSQFENCRFDSCSLQSSSILDSNLSNCNFTEASLSKTIALGTSSFTNGCFEKATATETGWRNIDLSGTSLREATFAKSDLAESSLAQSDMTDACFYQSLMSGAILDSVVAKNTDFHRAILRKARFDSSHLDSVNFQGADLFETTFINCKASNLKVDQEIRGLILD